MVKALTFLSVVLVIVGAAVFLGSARTAKARFYYLYICRDCGLQKSVKASKMGPVTYFASTSFHSTSISDALGTNGCGHSWLLYDGSRNFGTSVARTSLPGGKRRTVSIYVMLDDDTRAGELAHMDNPREKWRLLVTALATNRALDDSLLQWSQALPYRSFTSWWRQSPLGKGGSQ